MEKKRIIIIGAGISGLTAGIYALKAGFEAEIYESHTVAGGLCTGWNRKGYHIDGCLEWLTGSKKESSLYKLWEDCGALGEDIPVHMPEYIAATVHNSKTYKLHAQLDKMEQDLLEISPEDEKLIRQLIRNARRYENYYIPTEKPYEQMTLTDGISLMLKYMKVGKPDKRARKMSAGEYLSEFKSEIIRNLFEYIVSPDMPAQLMLHTLGTRSCGDGGFPSGGSYEMAQRMKKKFESLGGIIHLGQEVKKIKVENSKAIGIELKNGKEATADYIIPATDIFFLLHHLLDNKYKDPYFEKRFEDKNNYFFLRSTLVAFGIDVDMQDYPQYLNIHPEKPIRINNTEIDRFCMKNFSFDKTFAPEGKTLITIALKDDEYNYWQTLKEDSPEAYRQTKAQIARSVMDEITLIYPELKDKFEMTDVATPLTFNRYCHSYEGSYMSFIPRSGVKQEFHKGTIDGIDNLFLAGQWVFPGGGLPYAILAGKFAVQRICKKETIP